MMTPCPDPDKGHSPEWHSGPTQSLQFSGISGPKDPDPGVLRMRIVSEKDGEKMRRSILTVCIAVVVIALVVAPAAARVTAPTNIKDALLKGIWTALLDLQKQIDDLSKKINDLQARNVVVVSGHSSGGLHVLIDPPPGFTVDQCSLITSPEDFPCPSYAPFVSSISNTVLKKTDANPDGFEISARVYCGAPSGPNGEIGIGHNGDLPISYLLICTP
jgi:hypothetical protein